MTIAYSAEPARGVSLSTKSRVSFERAYRSAQRHSLHVRLLRFATIGGIAAVAITVVAANYMPPIGEPRTPGEVGKMVIKGTKITMQQPRLAGYTADGRAYEFTADAAAQDINKPDVLDLERIHAKMEMADKTTVKMTAATGVYDMKGEMLTLHKDIVLVSSTGYQGFLSDAVVDMRKGNVVSDKPVHVILLNGVLDGQQLEVIDQGELLRFTGGVAMTIEQGKNTATASQ